MHIVKWITTQITGSLSERYLSNCLIKYLTQKMRIIWARRVAAAALLPLRKTC